jgi:hypothetical protein
VQQHALLQRVKDVFTRQVLWVRCRGGMLDMMRRRGGRGRGRDEFNEEPAVLLRGRERGYLFVNSR